MVEKKTSERLGLVMELIVREEEAERRALGEFQAQIKSAELKVQELVSYQRQYQDELRGQGKKGAAAAGSTIRNLQNYHVFISRLGVAIEQQEQQILLLKQKLEVQTQKWRKIYQKKSNMADYIDRCRREEDYQADKKQQRELDDAVCRRSFYRSEG